VQRLFWSLNEGVIMRISIFLLSTAACVAALPAPVFAQEDSEDIVVTASGIAQPRDESGQAIAVIDRDRLDTLQSATITDALRTLPSVAVAQRGPVGSQTSIFLRGGNSAQTLVLVDGVRINDPSSPNGAFDFGALQSGNFERIELLRGANSVIWGSQAIGGVISLTSFIPTDAIAVRAVAEAGQADSIRTSANLSGASGALRGSIGGGYYRTDGISALTGGTERDGYDAYSANGRLEIALSDDAAIDLRGFYNRGRVEYDSPFGLGADALPESRNRQFVGYIGARASLFDDVLVNRVAFTRTDIDRLGTDPVAFSFNNFDISGSIDRFTYQGELRASPAITLIFGAEHEETRTSTSFEGAAPDLADNRVTGGYAQLILHPLAGLTFTGGVRHDDYSDYGSQTTLAANLAYSPNGGATLLRASYAEGFRAPTLSEGQPPFGNPALRPETAENFDIGIEQKLLDDRAAIGVTWFRRTSDDLIAFSFATFQSENIDRARASGVEVELVVRPTDRIDIRANWSRVDATNRTPGALFGKRLALRPQDSVTLTADWRTPWSVRVGTTISVTGDSFDNAANTVRLDGFALVAVRASLPLGTGIEAFARVENLFDASYATVAGYSTYGRGAFAGVRWTL
jgi:vitamin B12 transporter